MITAELLAKHGIKLLSTAPGRYYTTCPKCSYTRSKAHQGNKVLGVSIESDDSVHWGCNHCGWTGPTSSGKHRSDPPSYLYGPDLRKCRGVKGGHKNFWWQHRNGRGAWEKGTGGVD